MIKFQFDGFCWDTSTYKNISMELDNRDMTPFEVFVRWVAFMNASGYHLDPVEMEAMWNGESYETED